MGFKRKLFAGWSRTRRRRLCRRCGTSCCSSGRSRRAASSSSRPAPPPQGRFSRCPGSPCRSPREKVRSMLPCVLGENFEIGNLSREFCSLVLVRRDHNVLPLPSRRSTQKRALRHWFWNIDLDLVLTADGLQFDSLHVALISSACFTHHTPQVYKASMMLGAAPKFSVQPVSSYC